MLKYLILFFLFFSSYGFSEFSFNSSTFLLDAKPFRIRSGEMHFARIPPEYWRHRLQMAKAMGLNTIATYIFWNFHQPSENTFDFESPSHDLGHFLRLAQEEGLYVLLRPGPYVCAEWDFGGLPYWFLKYDDIKVRSYDQRYLSYVEKYIRRLAEIVVPLQIVNGGPILMVQIENEFGYFASDRPYLDYLQKLWRELGIKVPFYSADGASIGALSSGHVDGGALGLDAGTDVNAYKAAQLVDSKVVSFSSETYPGWLTHWGENWAGKSTENTCSEIEFILDYGKSFNMYVVHGGSNFAFWAGANDGDKGYQPHITSYDYDAPITESGNTTDKYFALRSLIAKYTNETFPKPPLPNPTIQIPKIDLKPWTSVWDNARFRFKSEFPKYFEFFDQFSGIIIYRTHLIEKTEGILEIKNLADYGLVFVDDEFIGTLDRSQANFSLKLPNNGKNVSKLEILVEAMGRINFGHNMQDRKGINGNVTLDGNILTAWEMANLPLDEQYVYDLKESQNPQNLSKNGIIFKGIFNLTEVGDTFIDVRQWEKGILYVNGKNLGRYWKIGPQYRLFCPASYLKKGLNSVLILDLKLKETSYITGEKTLK